MHYLELDKIKTFHKKYSFCTLVTNKQEYEEMYASAIQAGFDREDVEFLYLDNTHSNQFDGFSGINHALKHVQGRYLIFCHQDILFKFDTIEKLDQCIAELEEKDRNWAIAGNAGANQKGKLILRISDPHGDNVSIGHFPELVMSLDENFLIFNRQHNLAASANMSGFHLYGLDVCQNAQYLGYNCYVIDFHLLHKSAGKIDKKFEQAQKNYAQLQQKRQSQHFYVTTCTNFYANQSKLINFILNIKPIFKLYKSLKKRGYIN